MNWENTNLTEEQKDQLAVAEVGLELLRPSYEHISERIDDWYEQRDKRLRDLKVEHRVDHITSRMGNLNNGKIVKMVKQGKTKKLEQDMRRYLIKFLPRKIEIMKERRRLTKPEQAVINKWRETHWKIWELRKVMKNP